MEVDEKILIESIQVARIRDNDLLVVTLPKLEPALTPGNVDFIVQRAKDLFEMALEDCGVEAKVVILPDGYDVEVVRQEEGCATAGPLPHDALKKERG